MNHVLVWLVLLCCINGPLTGRPHRRHFKHINFKKNKHTKLKYRDFVTQRRDDVDIFQDFSFNHPILWSDTTKQQKQNIVNVHANTRQKIAETGSKKDGGTPQSEDEMPNTVGPNPNIYGGFPENDIWGNFELPSPETIDHLKLSLKMNHHRPNYAGDQASDVNDQLYGYEHHALPEYDILETPQFHETPQGQKVLSDMASAGEGGCPGLGSCPPLNGKIACQSIQTTCSSKEQESLAPVDYEAPCAAKILELFGCTKPESPPPIEAKQAPVVVPVKPKLPKHVKTEGKADTKLTKSESKMDYAEHKLKEHKLHQLEKENHGEDITQSENTLATGKYSESVIEKEHASFKSPLLDDGKYEMFQETSPQHFHENAKKKHSQEGTEEHNHGLVNSDASLALMQVVGNDLENTLSEKFSDANEKFEQKPDLIENFISNQINDSDATQHEQSGHNINETSEKQNSRQFKTSDNNTDDKELTSYFNSVTNDSQTSQNKVVMPEEDKQFSDWSIWSPCSSCKKGTKIRRRTCLKDQCSGSTEEAAPCVMTCQDKSPNEVPGMSLPDKQLLESIDPVTTSSHQPQNQLAAFQNQLSTPSVATSSPTVPSNPLIITPSTSTSLKDAPLVNFLNPPKSTQSEMAPTLNTMQSTPNILARSDNDKAKEFEQLILNKTYETVVSSFTKQLNESLNPQLQNESQKQQLAVANDLMNPKVPVKAEITNKDAQTIELLNNQVTSGPNTANNVGLTEAKTPHLVEQHFDSTQTILLNQGEDKNKINEYKSLPSKWGEWTECSSSCGIGVITRTLKTEKDVTVKDSESKYCHIKTCEDPLLEDSLKNGCLKLHNELRNRHDAGPLEWSNSLYKKAHEITERIAMNEIPQKNLSQYERPGLNLDFVSLNPSNNNTFDAPCKKAVSVWYGEKLNYDYETPKLTVEDRDFTQLVWKSTKNIGLARSFSPDGKSAYIAAVYDPVGNVDSLYDVKKHVMFQARKLTNEEKTEKILNSLMSTKHKKSNILNRYG